MTLKTPAELHDATEKISNLQRYIDLGLTERADLKRQLLESDARTEVLLARVRDGHQRLAEADDARLAVEDKLLAAKQQVRTLESERLAFEFKDAVVVRVEKEKMVLAARLELEEKRAIRLEENLKNLSVVEDMKKQMGEVESRILQEDLAKFVLYLKGKLNIEPNVQKTSFLDQEPDKNPTNDGELNKNKIGAFISWEEFNKNYDKFLEKGVLLPVDIQPSTDQLPLVQSLPPIQPLKTASQASLSIVDQGSNITFRPHGSFLDDPDLGVSQIPRPQLTSSQSEPNFSPDLAPNPAPTPLPQFLTTPPTTIRQPTASDSLAPAGVSGLRGLADITAVSDPSAADRPGETAARDKTEAEMFVTGHNAAGGQGSAGERKVVEDGAEKEERGVRDRGLHQDGQGISERWGFEAKNEIFDRVSRIGGDSLASDRGLVSNEIQDKASKHSSTLVDLKNTEIEQLEWTNDDLKMFEGLIDQSNEKKLFDPKSELDYFFTDNPSHLSKDILSQKIQVQEFTQTEKNNQLGDSNVENYEFDNETPIKTQSILKKSFEGVENIIKENPEQPQFKDYCQYLQSIVANLTDKDSFKESCLARSGVFFKLKDWNLILKSDSLTIDKASNKLRLELVIITQDPIYISSASFVNYGR
jgi:hypothetical protein